MGPGWRRDPYLETYMEVWWDCYGAGMQLSGPGWRWYTAWMEVRLDPEGDEVQIWDLRTEMRLDMDELEMHTSWTEWRWYVTWMEVVRYMDGDDIRIFWPGCRWGLDEDESYRDMEGVMHNLDGSETRPGRWWDANLWASDGVETGHGWTWAAHLVNRMKVICDPSGWGWDGKGMAMI